MNPTRAGALLRQLFVAAVWLTALPMLAQGPGVSPVRYTAAKSHTLRGEIQLPGTVESRVTSVVAGEVAGKVIAVNVREGDRVKKGRVLARVRSEYYELQHKEAVGRIEESQARLELAESRLARARELFEAEVVSQQELDDALSEYTAWRGRETQNRAQIDQLKLTLRLLEVRAPFNGVVTRKLTEVGQWIVSGGAVAEMVSLDRLDVRVDVPERYYDALNTGVTARLTFQALPGEALRGTIDRIVPSAEDQTRTFPVRLSIDNPEDRLGVGMLATVAMPVGVPREVTIVPKDAVVRQGPGEIVYRIGAGDAAERVEVTSGAGAGAWIAVRGGIRPGDRVIVRGNERLAPGQAVQPSEQEYPEP